MQYLHRIFLPALTIAAMSAGVTPSFGYNAKISNDSNVDVYVAQTHWDPHFCTASDWECLSWAKGWRYDGWYVVHPGGEFVYPYDHSVCFAVMKNGVDYTQSVLDRGGIFTGRLSTIFVHPTKQFSIDIGSYPNNRYSVHHFTIEGSGDIISGLMDASSLQSSLAAKGFQPWRCHLAEKSNWQMGVN